MAGLRRESCQYIRLKAGSFDKLEFKAVKLVVRQRTALIKVVELLDAIQFTLIWLGVRC